MKVKAFDHPDTAIIFVIKIYAGLACVLMAFSIWILASMPGIARAEEASCADMGAKRIVVGRSVLCAKPDGSLWRVPKQPEPYRGRP